MDLFDFPIGKPLAARVRPTRVQDFIGHDELIKTSGSLKSYLDSEENLPSLVLTGPPGTGKTSLAKILARAANRKVIEISAVNASVSDLREAFALSRSEIANQNRAGIVFVDEIHRFSKTQQESLLKAVEEGEIVLIGATTENPSFALTPAIVSRVTVIRLEPLGNKDLEGILQGALEDEHGLDSKFSISSAVRTKLASLSGGDARKALSLLEASSLSANRSGRKEITLEDVESSTQLALVRYDASGDEHYDVISAFIKSVRGSDPDAALHYLARMIVGGEDPRFICRRLVILASEDIGLADPNALVMANATMQIVSQIGMPEGRIPLAELTIFLSLSPKSNAAYKAINQAIDDVKSGFAPSIPLYLRSSVDTSDAKYEYPHDLPTKYSTQEYFGSDPKTYFEPGDSGFEKTLAERLRRLQEIRKNLGL